MSGTEKLIAFGDIWESFISNCHNSLDPYEPISIIDEQFWDSVENVPSNIT